MDYANLAQDIISHVPKFSPIERLSVLWPYCDMLLHCSSVAPIAIIRKPIFLRAPVGN